MVRSLRCGRHRSCRLLPLLHDEPEESVLIAVGWCLRARIVALLLLPQTRAWPGVGLVSGSNGVVGVQAKALGALYFIYILLCERILPVKGKWIADLDEWLDWSFTGAGEEDEHSMPLDAQVVLT